MKLKLYMIATILILAACGLVGCLLAILQH